MTIGNVHAFAGAWKLTGSQFSNLSVCASMSFFIIEGSDLFLANGTRCNAAIGRDGTSVEFQDSTLELVADGIAWLQCTGSSDMACYQRVHLPSPSYLLTLQGSWNCHGTRSGLQPPQNLAIHGPFWKIRDGHTTRFGVVHLHSRNGNVMIGDRTIQVTRIGSLTLHHPYEHLLVFWRSARHVQGWTAYG